MNESLHNLETIREYLLGRISDEKTLVDIEELLFANDDFCTKAEIVEDDLINEYISGELNGKDLRDFEETLINNSDRLSKVKITRSIKEKIIEKSPEERTSFFDSIKIFFRQPVYAGALGVLLVACLIAGIYIIFSSQNNEMAVLKNIYQNNRPFESRIPEFDYAPLEVTRGEKEFSDIEKRKLKIIESDLLKKVDQNPTAKNHNELGIFYLTQKKYSEASKEIEEAVKLEPNNAGFQNNLGSVYFEQGKQGDKNKRFQTLSRANEFFSKALELDPYLLPALFNRSLYLQENQLFNEARKSWELYLQKDSTSKWADEARKNLEKINQLEIGLNKSQDEILNDFLAAYRNNDTETFVKIHNSTKGLLNNFSLVQQLTNRYLEARTVGDKEISQESLNALIFIGEREKREYSDFFFSELADYYQQLPDSQLNDLIFAKKKLTEAFSSLSKGETDKAAQSFNESGEKLKKIGNDPEAKIAEQIIAELIIYDNKLKESSEKMQNLLNITQKKNYKVLSSDLLYYLGMSSFRQGEFSQAIKYLNSCLELSEQTENYFKSKNSSALMADTFSELGEVNRSLELLNQNNNQIALNYFPATFRRGNFRLIVQLLLRTNFQNTSVDFGNEVVELSKKSDREGELNESIYFLTDALNRSKKYELALESANYSIEMAQKLAPSNLTPKIIADAYQNRADIFQKTNRCSEALNDYQRTQEFYNQENEVSYNSYAIEKGKLLCYKQLNQINDFQHSLGKLLNLSELIRQKVREDELRQTFFDNEQIVLDLAIENALAQNQKEKAFEISEMLKSRSLLDLIGSRKSISESEREIGNKSKPLNLEEIQRSLPPDIQIVQYSVLPTKLIIWLITKDHFEQFEKEIESRELSEQIENYLILLKQNGDLDSLNRSAKKLHQILIPSSLEKDKIICFIPDKSLHQIPFSSLISEDDKYLIEDYALLNSPSSSILIALTQNSLQKPKVESILSFGNPAFDRQTNPELQDLTDAEIEAKEITKNYPDSKQFFGHEAGKQLFLSEINKSEIIHFAGHFVVNQETLNKSKMVFADSDLYAFELFDLKLPKAKLVVLSACQTGFEKLNKSEGSIGIARTFLAMGTPIVVSSYWKVDSEATKDLMILFHRNRTENKLSSIRSLRQAQLEMLKKRDFNHPKFWSGFAINGGSANF